MPAARKIKTDRRAAPAALTPEERCIFTLGKVAVRFVAADREAREIRQQRDFLRGHADYVHDATPCYLIGVKEELDWDGDGEDEEVNDRLPSSEWCDACRRYAEAYNAAVFAYYKRRSARQALTAAYRRLVRLREAPRKE